MPKSFSRTAVDLFCECPRCFYLLHQKGLKRPPGYPFTLNAAVDKLAKEEFDTYRKAQTNHPIMPNTNMTPLQHPDIETWQSNRVGIRFHYNGYDFYGAVDDVWVNHGQTETWHVVDYKATAKKDPVTELDPNAEHHQSYMRQISFYTWLFEQNGYPVSNTTYFYYTTGDNTLAAFNNTLHFRTHLVTYVCQTDWVQPTIDALIACYEQEHLPPPSESCKYCAYVSAYEGLF